MSTDTNMSYMLQFPPSELPKDVLDPPYVLFGINSVDTFSKLPNNIPLALVLHFAPDLRKWLLPPPELSFSAARLAARVPFVTIDIKADIEIEGLSYILARIVQTANIKVQSGGNSTFMINPNLLTSISIYKAWVALGLSPYGINGLYLHIQSNLMLGGPVSLAEMKVMWHTFPITAPLLEHMGWNYARSYVAMSYTPQERLAIQHWYLETTERWTFFRRFEKMYSAWDDVQKEAVKAASMRHARELYTQRMHHTTKQARNVSSGSASTMNSISSSGTAIWDPISSRSQSESSATSDSDSIKSSRSLSKPVDSSKLVAMLKNMAVQSQLRDTNFKASKTVVAELNSKKGEVKKTVDSSHVPTKVTTAKKRGLDAGEALGTETCAPSKSLASAKSKGPSSNASKRLSANAYVLQPSVKSQVATLDARELHDTTTYIPSKSTKPAKHQESSLNTGGLLSAAVYVPQKSTKTTKPQESSLNTENLLSAVTYKPAKPAGSTSNIEKLKPHSTVNSKATRELVTEALTTADEVLTRKAPKAPEVRVQDFAKVDADGIRSIDFAAVHAARDHTPVWKGRACLVTEKRVAKMAELREAERKAIELQASKQDKVVMETNRGDEAEKKDSKGSVKKKDASAGGKGGLFYLSSTAYRP